MARRFSLLLTPLLAGCALVAGIDTFESASTASIDSEDASTLVTTVDGSFDAPSNVLVEAATDAANDALTPPPTDGAGSHDTGGNATPDAPPPNVDCTGLADGTQWNPSDPTARCCGGAAVNVTTNENCGACGITCNTAYSQSCGQRNGAYYCLGCAATSGGIGGLACWSLCCSTKFFTEGACVPEGCFVQNTPCLDNTCAKHAATCHNPSASSSYCGYD